MDDEGATIFAARPIASPTSGIDGSNVPYASQRLCHAYPGSEPGAYFVDPHFPLVPTLGSTHSAADRSALFVGFTATMAGSRFSRLCIIGYRGSSPSRCGPSLARDADGQTRDLPASDAIPLHVMWPSTPAGRQHLAWRCRTCCLRANKNSRPPRCLIFRGSIPHPMQFRPFAVGQKTHAAFENLKPFVLSRSECRRASARSHF